MDLAARTWTDLERDPPSAALVPVGSVEQHGPHAPLGTDLLIATAIADRATALSDLDPATTPPVPIGVAEEHRGFAGSLWVPEAAFRGYVKGIAESLAHHGVEVVVFVNGHGGNVPALEAITGQLTRNAVCRAAAFTWFKSLRDPPHPMGHGGLLETAAVMAIDPTLVREDRLDDAHASASDRWGRWVGGVNLAVDVDEFSENGVVGDPREASAALGDDLLDEAAERLVEVLDALAGG